MSKTKMQEFAELCLQVDKDDGKFQYFVKSKWWEYRDTENNCSLFNYSVFKEDKIRAIPKEEWINLECSDITPDMVFRYTDTDVEGFSRSILSNARGVMFYHENLGHSLIEYSKLYVMYEYSIDNCKSWHKCRKKA